MKGEIDNFMKVFKNILSKVLEYKKLISALSGNEFPIAVTGLSDVHKAHIIYSLCKDISQKVVFISANESEASDIIDDLVALGINAVMFPLRDLCFREFEGVSKEYEHKRIKALSKITDGDFEVLVTSIEATLLHTIPKNIFNEKKFTLKKNMEISLEEVCNKLLSCGYERFEKVDGMGQFSVRGGIVDLFSPGLDLPIRIDFFGDEIDNICEFGLENQRRIRDLDEVSVSVSREVLIDDKDKLSKKIMNEALNIKNKNPKAYKVMSYEADRISQGATIISLDKYINVIYSSVSTLFDYIPEDMTIFASETVRIKEAISSFNLKWKEELESYIIDGTLCDGLHKYSEDAVYLIDEISKRKSVYMDVFAHKSYALAPKLIINFNAYKLPVWRGEISTLSNDIKPLISNKGSILVLAGSERFARVLADDLVSYGIDAVFLKDCNDISQGKVVVTEGSLSSGFRYQGSNISVISHGRYKHKKKKPRVKGKEIFDLSDLEEGNYVVHSQHGIGIFSGVHEIEMNGVSKDYIKLLYDRGDILYVPVTQMDMVSKYIGSKEDVKLRLNKLGSTTWQNTKKRVKSEVKDIAKDLIKLYSERMNAPGFSFSEDNEFQRDFDNRFEYEETDDQLRSINEIKRDMQKRSPMDRLLCGDVGFGKTEVALRAACKCLIDGKQCAMLVPTTILAWQHFQTTCRRFEGFPFKIELLSRFRTPKQQQEIVKSLKDGDIDFVIGTHRLVQKDIKFKDLGLVIIDEEQRFGVAHKEKFKAMSKNVDVLTLSATPIPRTLNMAMTGIRDMSAIEEAPQDRCPVQTYVMEYDKGVVYEAIRREIRRGGQVYYLHNRVESINRVASEIANDIYEANVGIAHGQMSESELSDVWQDLLEQKINVLVCTTIIETGVDVPNANTLIIDNADCMGLSQLHQLRGRVGRSSRRAYAYFTFRKNKVLSEIAQKRLSAIRDFTEFGSGFKIAMRDLELRGAGNIIGAQQHGNMEAVGYDMYLNLLGEAVKQAKGENIESYEIECLIDIDVSANIQDNYIASLGQRLSMYRKISAIRLKEDVIDVVEELKDRFGTIPIQTLNLIRIAYIRSLCSQMNIYEIKQRGRFLFLYKKDMSVEDFAEMFKRLKGKVAFSAGNKPYLSIKMNDNDDPIDILNEAFNIEQIIL